MTATLPTSAHLVSLAQAALAACGAPVLLAAVKLHSVMR